MNQSNEPNRFAPLLQRLRDPLQLRIFITGLFVAIAYLGIHSPLCEKIETVRRDLRQQQEHQELVNDVEYLRAQVDLFHQRLPKNADVNNWVQYVLDGTRRFPLKLLHLDSEKLRRVGTYKAYVLRVELEGKMVDLDSFLTWLETNDRVFRIDSIKIAPRREKTTQSGDTQPLVLQLTVLGLNS